MKDIYEFRIAAAHAKRLFGEAEGKKLGDSVVKILISRSDPRFNRIGELQKKLRPRKGEPFFYSCASRRSYTENEIKSATLFLLNVTGYSNTYGYEHGSQYETIEACPECGCGTRLNGSLYLIKREIPKGKDLFRLLTGEVVVTAKFRTLLIKSNANSVEFGRVVIGNHSKTFTAKKAKFLNPDGTTRDGYQAEPIQVNPKLPASEDFYYLCPKRGVVEFHPEVFLGYTPFESRSLCQCGRTVGGLVMSPPIVLGKTITNESLQFSKKQCPAMRGTCSPFLFVSSSLRDLMMKSKILGCGYEPVSIA